MHELLEPGYDVICFCRSFLDSGVESFDYLPCCGFEDFGDTSTADLGMQMAVALDDAVIAQAQKGAYQRMDLGIQYSRIKVFTSLKHAWLYYLHLTSTATPW